MSIGAKYPLKKIREGKAELLIPDPKAYIRSNGTYEPAWAPVFYNPRMVFSRDMTVLFLRYLANKGIGISLALDSLSGTGVRGIRFLLEPGNVEKVILNDIDPDAYELINENIRLNDLQERAESYCMDANTLHYYLPEVGLRAEFVDIDPFGSPIPFIDSAIWVARNKSYIAITATDTAALTGTHINACLRKYHARPLRLD
ncbi:MAG TPA: tRNA (guanine(10)-N(2))-dimethyltransferase, partial [Desulfurococcaceae archaeon]|nr:tRNA (guanine(10)-N(2))-dimethyltransferase [Desulfurococcaceae archaeon]